MCLRTLTCQINTTFTVFTYSVPMTCSLRVGVGGGSEIVNKSTAGGGVGCRMLT